MEPEVILSVRLSAALDRELEKLAQETGRNKSELVREALTSLVGMYRNAIAEGKN